MSSPTPDPAPRRFGGIFIAMNACYDSSGALAPDAIRRLCIHYRDLGVKGVYVCGSTGEGLLLSTDERKRTLETVMETVGKDLTVMAHVGAPATRDAMDLAIHAARHGCHAVSAVPCIYYQPSEAGIELHWNRIAEAAGLPFFIYNLPQLTGYNLSMPLFRRMLKNPLVAGIKNSSESVFQIQQFKQEGGPGFIVFNGPDQQYLAGRLMGADGGIGGTYGCMPELFLRLETMIRANRIDEARRLQGRINGFIVRLMEFPSTYGAIKTVITLRNTYIGDPRPPFLPVPADGPAIRELSADIERCAKETFEP